MKLSIAFVVLLIVGCASCSQEDEDFAPFPGGKGPKLSVVFYNPNP